MRPVRCVETGEVYQGAIAAARIAGVSPTRIYGCCNGDFRTAAGYHWEYLDQPRDVGSGSVFVKRHEDRWGVFYKDILLKAFKAPEYAYIYAQDSALEKIKDVEPVKVKRSKKGRSIRHIETGIVYSSIVQAAFELGISDASIHKVLSGERKSYKGQHFERVKED